MKYGYLVDSLREKMVGIAPEDLSRHVYILGSTGSGKSTLIRNLYKHLEMANHTGILENASIYIDVKDEDAELFLRQCEESSLDNYSVTYLDINKTSFGINLLELPKYETQDRDMVVSKMVGHIIEMFKEFYLQQQTYVQLERVMRLLLHYLYSNTDTPTLLDLYQMIARLQEGRERELLKIFQHYKKIPDPEIKTALNSITSLRKDSWVSLFNRIEPFATDNYLKRKFAVRRTTIDFEKMLEPGSITIFRISDTDTPKHVHGLAIMAVVIKIWFAIQERASRVERQKRTLVVLALDEFQRIKDLSILVSILSQARAYNLGLVLSHQNLAQIDAELLETIIGNTATQFYGRISGIDAGRIAKIIDPEFADDLTGQLATQPDYTFTAKLRPPEGQGQGLPVQLKASRPPPIIIDEAKTADHIEKMKKHYGVYEIIHSELISEDDKISAWKRQMRAEFRTKDEWAIILCLRRGDAYIKQIVEVTKSLRRDRTRQILHKLAADGIVHIDKTMPSGCIVRHKGSLTPEARSLYFPQKFQSIGTAADIHEVATIAFNHYLDKQMFVSLAKQHLVTDEKMTDMVAYDYENDSAISVEIESIIEARSHEEQVRLNMTKWRQMGFSECHVWSKSTKVVRIKQGLGKEADGTKVFLINKDNSYTMV